MSWYCVMGPDCCSSHTDGKGGHTISDPVDRMLAEYFGTDYDGGDPNVGDPPPHGLCGYCYLAVFGPFPIYMSPDTVPPRRTT